MSFSKTILCVDDNEDNNELLQFLFENEGYKVITCSTADECSECIMDNDFSAIILDYRLPDKDGLDILREIKESNPHLPIVFFTADAVETSRQKSIEAGADAYLVKPNDLTNIVPTVIKLIETNYIGVY